MAELILGKEDTPMVCLCKKSIAMRDFTMHALSCEKFKARFKCLPEAIMESIQKADDTGQLGILINYLMAAREQCELKIQELVMGRKQEIPQAPMPPPIIPQVPKNPIQKEELKIPPAKNPIQKEELKIPPAKIPENPMAAISPPRELSKEEEGKVYCKLCKTFFMDFKQALYLECVHSFCKECLRKIVYK